MDDFTKLMIIIPVAVIFWACVGALMSILYLSLVYIF